MEKKDANPNYLMIPIDDFPNKDLKERIKSLKVVFFTEVNFGSNKHGMAFLIAFLQTLILESRPTEQEQYLMHLYLNLLGDVRYVNFHSFNKIKDASRAPLIKLLDYIGGQGDLGLKDLKIRLVPLKVREKFNEFHAIYKAGLDVFDGDEFVNVANLFQATGGKLKEDGYPPEITTPVLSETLRVLTSYNRVYILYGEAFLTIKETKGLPKGFVLKAPPTFVPKKNKIISLNPNEGVVDTKGAVLEFDHCRKIIGNLLLTLASSKVGGILLFENLLKGKLVDNYKGMHQEINNFGDIKVQYKPVMQLSTNEELGKFSIKPSMLIQRLKNGLDSNEDAKSIFDSNDTRIRLKNLEKKMKTQKEKEKDKADKEKEPITLKCKHKANHNIVSSKAIKIKEKMPKGAAQMLCTIEGCNYVMEDCELSMLLGRVFTKFIDGYNDYPYEEDIEDQCILCYKVKDKNRIIHLHKNHNVCIRCMRKYVFHHGKNEESFQIEAKSLDNKYGPRLAPIKCPARACLFRFGDAVILKVIQSGEYLTILERSLEKTVPNTAELMEKKKAAFKSEKQIAMSRVKHDEVDCGICGKTVSKINVVNLMKCKDNFCASCIKNYIEAEEKKRIGIHALLCPNEYCRKPIPIEVVKSSCGPDVATKFEQQTKKQLGGYFECPVCDDVFVIPKKVKGRNVHCNTCDKDYCRICITPKHSGICIERKRLIENARKAGGSTELMPCPFCLQMSTKDERCNHVTCYFCKKDFCFKCSAKRSPTMAHGCHYHRRHCKIYAGYTGKDVYKPDECEECSRLGKLCTRPSNLIDMDIPDNEIPEELTDE